MGPVWISSGVVPSWCFMWPEFSRYLPENLQLNRVKLCKNVRYKSRVNTDPNQTPNAIFIESSPPLCFILLFCWSECLIFLFRFNMAEGINIFLSWMLGVECDEFPGWTPGRRRCPLGICWKGCDQGVPGDRPQQSGPEPALQVPGWCPPRLSSSGPCCNQCQQQFIQGTWEEGNERIRDQEWDCQQIRIPSWVLHPTTGCSFLLCLPIRYRRVQIRPVTRLDSSSIRNCLPQQPQSASSQSNFRISSTWIKIWSICC